MSNIEIILGDCMEIMAKMPDKAFELAIVDPPYGINAPNMQMGNGTGKKGKYGPHGESWASRLKKGRLNSGAEKLKDRALQMMPVKWDFEIPPPEYFLELARVCVNQIIWGGNYFDLGPTRCFVVWDKVQPWENFSQCEMAWTSFDGPAAHFTHSNTGGNIKSFEKKIHPTQKPISLYQYLLRRYAKPGDKIIDTHLGSGSSAIAADIMGYDLVGIEIDVDYYNGAVDRFNRHKQQCVLELVV